MEILKIICLVIGAFLIGVPAIGIVLATVLVAIPITLAVGAGATIIVGIAALFLNNKD